MMIVYLLARYARLHGLPAWVRRHAFAVYLASTAAIVLVAQLLIAGGNEPNRAYFYTSPLVLLAAVSCFYVFEKLRIAPSRLINHLAQSCLAILLLHTDSFFPYMERAFTHLWRHHSGLSLAGLWLVALLAVAAAGIAVDQLRIALWQGLERSLWRTKG